jgi:predicted ATPase
MHISHVAIRNFRAIADIDCELKPRVNVIVGPNAVGKTTILQAIRLAKALVAPRTQHEIQNVLISLSAASPHFPQRLFLNSLARDPTQQVEIRCVYVLTDQEIAIFRSALPSLAQNITAARVGQTFTNPAALTQFLTSPQGQLATRGVTQEILGALDRLEKDKSLMVGVALGGTTGQIVPSDPLGGPLVGFLDQNLPPSKSFFSYFPADRALPMGEVNLQVGGGDVIQQLESHNSQPQLKYARLKNMIINSMVIDEADRQTVHSDFENIFSGLLKGRRIKTVQVNELGLLSVITEDLGSGRLVELDSLSSGEKNIALTFLMVARSIANGGIALFDEPELHLNPAVSRDVLSFVMSTYSKPRDIQFIMCTHSPEILSGAFTNEECNLLHLKSASNITHVGKRARGEYADALQRLGTSVSESLLYEGTVLVEGDDDVSFLENGFPETFKKFNVKARGGRHEVEKAISDIQMLENKDEKVNPIFVIFDRDDEPTKLQDSEAVKVLQWPRRCVENYLLDTDVLADLLSDPDVVKTNIPNEGEVHKLLRELAYSQLDAISAREIYNSHNYLNASLTKEDIKSGNLTEIATALFERMSNARASLSDAPRDAWISAFQIAAEVRKGELLLKWESKWKELCDGKKLISDLHKAISCKMSESAFKARIVARMHETRSETWQVVKGLLDDLVKRAGNAPAGG